jgi:uncharacterized membrane protein required for colicin V production
LGGSLNVVDVGVGVAVAWFALRAFFRGFLTQALVLLSVAAGLLAAFGCHEFLEQWWGRGGGMTLLALRFLISLTAGILAFGLLQWAAERVGERVHASLLGPVNRAAGLVLGAITGLLVSALGLLLLVSAPVPSPVRKAVHESWSAHRLFRTGEQMAWASASVVPGSRWLARSFRQAFDPSDERSALD